MRQSGQEDVENGKSMVKKTFLGAAALAGFGVWYAGQVNEAEETGEIEGQSSLWVAVGTLVTITVRHWTMPRGKTRAEGWLYTLLAFFCSGTPMILNQLDGYIRLYAEYRRRQRKEQLCHENQTGLLDGLMVAGQCHLPTFYTKTMSEPSPFYNTDEAECGANDRIFYATAGVMIGLLVAAAYLVLRILLWLHRQ